MAVKAAMSAAPISRITLAKTENQRARGSSAPISAAVAIKLIV